MKSALRQFSPAQVTLSNPASPCEASAAISRSFTAIVLRIGACFGLLASFAFVPLRAAEIVNLTVGPSGQPENTVADGPPAVLGSKMPGTTTVPSVSADTASGQGSVINFDGGQLVQFEDASRFAFFTGKKFTIAARLFVESKSQTGSVYLVNHWAYGGTDRSLAVRLVAQGGKITPTVTIRNADDVSHATIEPKDVSWGAGQWVHFAVVGDGSMLSFWLDGVESTSSYEIPEMRNSFLPLVVGGVGGAFVDDPRRDYEDQGFENSRHCRRCCVVGGRSKEEVVWGSVCGLRIGCRAFHPLDGQYRSKRSCG